MAEFLEKEILGMMIENEQHIDELARSIKFLLNARRGKFYPNKNYGSLLRDIFLEPKSEYALSYARQALDGIDGVYVKSAKLRNNNYIFSLIINGYEREVEIKNDNILQ